MLRNIRRIDHLAFRVSDQFATVRFFERALNYTVSKDLPQGFRVDFDDDTYADCVVMTPLNKESDYVLGNFHLPPEIFISQGSKGSIVDSWVKQHGSGLHHIAIQVDDIEKSKKEWKDEGYASFTTDYVLECEDLKQIFTNPLDVTGIVWELIERSPGGQGFCKENVKDLMKSTKKE